MNRYFIFLLHLFNGTAATMIGGMLRFGQLPSGEHAFVIQ